MYDLALKFYVKYNNLHFTLWYSAYIIVVCCISCFGHDCLDCHLFFNSCHELKLLLVCYENLRCWSSLFTISVMTNLNKTDVNLLTFIVNLSVFVAQYRYTHYSSTSSIRYLILTKWTLYCRIGQLGLNGLGGEEDINAAPAHYRVRERRERRCERPTFRQRVRYTAQTCTPYYLLVLSII